MLVSKNRADCRFAEKQIQFVMRLQRIKPLAPGEVEQYWPGNEGRWRYLVECAVTHRLRAPFNVRDVLRNAADSYDAVLRFKKFAPADEQKILEHIRKADADAIGEQ